MASVFKTQDQKLIADLIQKYKDALEERKAILKKLNAQQDPPATDAEKEKADIEVTLAKKRSTEVQLAYKMQVDDYNRRVAEAAAAA